MSAPQDGECTFKNGNVDSRQKKTREGGNANGNERDVRDAGRPL